MVNKELLNNIKFNIKQTRKFSNSIKFHSLIDNVSNVSLNSNSDVAERDLAKRSFSNSSINSDVSRKNLICWFDAMDVNESERPKYWADRTGNYNIDLSNLNYSEHTYFNGDSFDTTHIAGQVRTSGVMYRPKYMEISFRCDRRDITNFEPIFELINGDKNAAPNNYCCLGLKESTGTFENESINLFSVNEIANGNRNVSFLYNIDAGNVDIYCRGDLFRVCIDLTSNVKENLTINGKTIRGQYGSTGPIISADHILLYLGSRQTTPNQFGAVKIDYVRLYSEVPSEQEKIINLNHDLNRAQESKKHRSLVKYKNSIRVTSIDKPHPSCMTILKVIDGRLVLKTDERCSLVTYKNKTLEECIVEETEDYVLYSDGVVTPEDPIPEGIYFACRVDKVTNKIDFNETYNNILTKTSKHHFFSSVSGEMVDDGLASLTHFGYASGGMYFGDKDTYKRSTKYAFYAERVTNKTNVAYSLIHNGAFSNTDHITNGDVRMRHVGLTRSTYYNDWRDDFGCSVYLGVSPTNIGESSKVKVMLVENADWNVPYVKTRNNKTKIIFKYFNIEGRSVILKDVRQRLRTTSDGQKLAQVYFTWLGRDYRWVKTFESVEDSADIRSKINVDVVSSSSYNRVFDRSSNVSAPLQHNSSGSQVFFSLGDPIWGIDSIGELYIYDRDMSENELVTERNKSITFESSLDYEGSPTSFKGIENISSANSFTLLDDEVRVGITPDASAIYSLGVDEITGRLSFYSSDPVYTIKTANNKPYTECIVEETDEYVIYSDGEVTPEDPVPNSITFGCYINKLERRIYVCSEMVNTCMNGNFYGMEGKEYFTYDKNSYTSVKSAKHTMFASRFPGSNTPINGRISLETKILNFNKALNTYPMIDSAYPSANINNFKQIYHENTGWQYLEWKPSDGGTPHWYSSFDIDPGVIFEVRNTLWTNGIRFTPGYFKHRIPRGCIEVTVNPTNTHENYSFVIKKWKNKQDSEIRSRNYPVSMRTGGGLWGHYNFGNNECGDCDYDITADNARMVKTDGTVVSGVFSKNGVPAGNITSIGILAFLTGEHEYVNKYSSFERYTCYGKKLTSEDMKLEVEKSVALEGEGKASKFVVNDFNGLLFKEGYIEKIMPDGEGHVPSLVTNEVNDKFDSLYISPSSSGVYKIYANKGSYMSRVYKRYSDQVEDYCTRLVYLP